MQRKLQLQLLLVFRSLDLLPRVRGVRAGEHLFSYSITPSTHSHHLHNPQFLPLLAIIPLECYEKLKSRFALEHRYGSVLSRSTRTSSTEQHRVHTHCECGHAVCQVFQLSHASRIARCIEYHRRGYDSMYSRASSQIDAGRDCSVEGQSVQCEEGCLCLPWTMD